MYRYSMDKKADLLPGTLEMMILQAIKRTPLHGYAIAQRIQQASGDVLQVGEGSLYPALQRLLLNGFVEAEWGQSDNRRRVRFYKPTAAGRKQLQVEISEFDRILSAIAAVMQTV